MRKGEQFVMNEVRARARERARWIVGAILLGLAVFSAPFSIRDVLARFPGGQ